MECIGKYKSPLGEMTLAGSEEGLSGLWFDGQKYFGSTLTENHKEGDLPVFKETKEWLDIYFSGKNPDFTPPLVLSASPFRKSIWEIMLNISYGKTRTYKEISEIIAKRRGLAHMSAQAIGGAVAHNPIMIILPCHRMVGANGSLTGYAGGIERKIALLKLENADMKNLFVPKRGTAL